jgi:hypothetical protein
LSDTPRKFDVRSLLLVDAIPLMLLLGFSGQVAGGLWLRIG